MKRILFIAVVSIMIATTGKAGNNEHKNEPGKKITESFNKDFPLANKIGWTKNANGDFIAKFTQDNKSYQAYYSESGEYLGQGWHTELKDLSAIVQQEIIRFAKSLSQIRSIYLFLPASGFPKHYTTIIRHGKVVTLKTDSYGETTIVDEKRSPFKN